MHAKNHPTAIFVEPPLADGNAKRCCGEHEAAKGEGIQLRDPNDQAYICVSFRLQWAASFGALASTSKASVDSKEKEPRVHVPSRDTSGQGSYFP